MKKILDKFLDIIYDYLDYIVMLAIVLIVVGIIGWRLDIIFTADKTVSKKPPTENFDENNDIESEEPGQAGDPLEENDEPLEDETQKPEESNDAGENDDLDPVEDDLEENQEDDDEEVADEPEVDDNVEVAIAIPSGTMPHEIANLLLEVHLINDTSAFINRAEELNVIRRLKAGDYMIPANCSLDEILEILSR